MPNPQAYEFWAPTPRGVDASPIVQGAQIAAAGYMAAGQAVGEGLAQGIKEQLRQAAQESIGGAMQEIGKESNYDTVNVDPSLEDPTLVSADGAPLDAIGRRQLITERMVKLGYPQEVAQQRALQATTPVPTRVMKPGVAEKIRGLKAQALVHARKAGMDPADIERGIALVQPEGYESIGLAHRSALKGYSDIVAPPATELAALQANLSGREAEKERAFRVQEAKDSALRALNEIRVRAGITDKQAAQQNTWALERMAVEDEFSKGASNRSLEANIDLANLANRQAKERMVLQSRLDTEQGNDIARTKGEMAQELQQLKASGGVTPAEEKTGREFALTVEGSTLSGASPNGVPFRAVSGMVSDLGDYVRVGTGGQLEPGQELINLNGGTTSNDLTTLVAKIGPDGKVHLQDTNPSSRFTKSQLETIARSAFDSPTATYAVVMQQFYRGAYKGADTLSQLVSLNDRAAQVGGTGVLESARALLARIAAEGGLKASEPQPGFVTDEPATGGGGDNPWNTMAPPAKPGG